MNEFLSLCPENYNQETILKNPSLCNKYCETYAMFLSNNYKIPQKKFLHDPTFRDSNGETVAMKLASRGKSIPSYWDHDPCLQDNNGWTVAIHAINSGFAVPDNYLHDPDLEINSGKTAAMFFIFNGITIPKHWLPKEYSHIKPIVRFYIKNRNTNFVPKEYKQYISSIREELDQGIKAFFDNINTVNDMINNDPSMILLHYGKSVDFVNNYTVSLELLMGQYTIKYKYYEKNSYDNYFTKIDIYKNGNYMKSIQGEIPMTTYFDKGFIEGLLS